METVLISSFGGGEVFRSGCTWQRGQGRIFYFRPGHELFPTYYDRNVMKIVENAVRWAAPTRAPGGVRFGKREQGWVEGT
jgi:trehalose utilization protein